jgi:prephenate dehydratase
MNSFADENPASVACLGPEGSFSHEFALSRFPDAVMHCVEGEFEEVLAKLKDGTCDAAVLPFLNSNGLDVRPAQAAIAASRDWICVNGCHPHKVSHNLVVTEHFRTLQRVVSKEQVFPQCENWLKQWAGIEKVSASSTSAALKALLVADVTEQTRTGVICNTLAHQLYGGVLKYHEIENPGNVTLFLVLSRGCPEPGAGNVLVCLTCPTEECYQHTIDDFHAAGYPLKFTSLKGEFTDELPCFLQFEVSGQPDTLRRLLGREHRKMIGVFPEKASLAACVAGLFDDID